MSVVANAWVATCPPETRDVLRDELVALGARDVVPGHRSVAFSAELETAYRAHLCLRTASRIQRVVARVPATSPAALVREVSVLRWAEALRNTRPYRVELAAGDAASRAWDVPRVTAELADAVARGFGDGAPAYKAESDAAVEVVVHVREGVATVGLDTAGMALHKRGWRTQGHPAVLKETLAASVLMLAGYTGDEPLVDPMCGSGTLIIEGAYIALGKAPLIHRGRGDFALEHTAGFDRALWRQVQDRVRAQRRAEPAHVIHASDLRGDYVEVARKAALKARVEKHITFSAGRFQDAVPPAPSGLLVGNMPYGERIHPGQQAALYADMAELLRGRFRGWRSALLVPTAIPRGPLVSPGTREVPLKNGALDVLLLLSPAR